MNNIKSGFRWAFVKKMLLALPFLALLGVSIPNAQADEHHGFYHRHGYYRHHYHHYNHRGYYYRHGHRYYGRPGVNVNVGL